MTDSVSIRNGSGGRTSSQISIYDYPEHLNPFYEDENHKRLRFWKIGKKNGGASRRGSFSFGGLKEMWAFKSFRLKKKSSSLGINKTSESPPSLRRWDQNEPNYGTYDPRMRHTTGINGVNNNFQRNVPYRASLQDMRANEDINRNGIGFVRNDRYRSTVQTPERSLSVAPVAAPRRYVYGGSVTPQPRPRHNGYNSTGHPYEHYRGISRGSSQISVASTNPFEDDDDDVIVGRLDSSETESDAKHTPTKRPARKKRRAPPPPIPIPKIIDEEEPLSAPTSPTTSHANQNERSENNVDITNLTAEIETFVKIKSEEGEIPNSPSKPPARRSVTPEIVVTASTPTTPEDITIQPLERTQEMIKKKNEIEVQHTEVVEIHKTVEENTQNKTIIDTAKPLVTITETQVSKVDIKPNHEKFVDESNLIIREDSPDGQDANINLSTPVVELKITESKEDLSEISNENSDKYEIKYAPLKESTPESTFEADVEIRNKFADLNNRSHVESNKGTVAYERRRSVKEIIESINKSQSLLKVNHEQNPNSPAIVVNNLNGPGPGSEIRAPPRKSSPLKNNLNQNYRELAESEKEIKRILNEMDKMDNTEPNGNADFPEIIEKINQDLENDTNNNEAIFKKCTIRKEVNREASPTSSNLDWNPVPKPKRSKNLSAELGDRLI